MDQEDLDKVLFKLNESDYERFVSVLDNPPQPNQKLIELMQRKPIWKQKVNYARK